MSEVEKIQVLLIGVYNGEKPCLFLDLPDAFGHPTIFPEFYHRQIEHRGRKLKIQMWNLAPQSQYPSSMPAYYQRGQAAALVFDVSNKSSFLALADKYIP